MRRVAIALSVVVLLLVACAPGTNVRIEVPGNISALEDLAGPPADVFAYTELGEFEYFREFHRVAKIVHPRYRFAEGRISFGGSEIARYFAHRLTTGVTRVTIAPSSHDGARQLAPLVEAWAEAGVTTRGSGLPAIEPLPVPAAMSTGGGELYRYYPGVSGGTLRSHGWDCVTDYLAGSVGQGRSPGFSFDVTEMPDGRARLYVRVGNLTSWSLSERAKVPENVGLFLACLDARLGPGQEG